SILLHPRHMSRFRLSTTPKASTKNNGPRFKARPIEPVFFGATLVYQTKGGKILCYAVGVNPKTTSKRAASSPTGELGRGAKSTMTDSFAAASRMPRRTPSVALRG